MWRHTWGKVINTKNGIFWEIFTKWPTPWFYCFFWLSQLGSAVKIRFRECKDPFPIYGKYSTKIKNLIISLNQLIWVWKIVHWQRDVMEILSRWRLPFTNAMLEQIMFCLLFVLHRMESSLLLHPQIKAIDASKTTSQSQLQCQIVTTNSDTLALSQVRRQNLGGGRSLAAAHCKVKSSSQS